MSLCESYAQDTLLTIKHSPTNYSIHDKMGQTFLGIKTNTMKQSITEGDMFNSNYLRK